MSRAFIFLFCLISALPAFGQHDHHSRRPHSIHERQQRVQDLYVPRQNVLTTSVNIGPVTGFFGARGGVEYERYIGKNGYYSLTISADDYAAGTLTTSGFHRNSVHTKLNGSYIAPGFRCHLDGNSDRSDIALGLAFPIGEDHRREQKQLTSAYYETESSREFFGAVLAQIVFSFRNNRGFVVAPWLNAGIAYSNTKPILSNNTSQVVVQFGMKLGGQW